MRTLFPWLADRWRRPAGFRDVLVMAFPLIMSTSSWSILHFIDRMFLCWYSPQAMAAALPAGFFAYTMVAFFVGVVSYANAFVAQYHGAGRPERIGPVIWQAIWFSLLIVLLLPVMWPLAPAIFRIIGHAPDVQPLEVGYFRVMMVGAVANVYLNAVFCFYSGRGRNWPLVWVNFLITLVNIVLGYAMIFGHWGFPRWGIEGAAWATNIAQVVGAVALTIGVFGSRRRAHYHLLRGWRFDRALFVRLMRFGVPSGVQFMLDVLAFAFFLFIVGRIGTVELTATNLAFQINTLAFLPMIGFGIATTTLVGQWLGRENPVLAARATWSAFGMTFTYMATVSALFVIFPDAFLAPFASHGDSAIFHQVRPIAHTILTFVAVYCLFDTMNIIFASALKGAGDTRFVMIVAVAMGWAIMVLPTWWLCDRGPWGIRVAWTFLSLFVSTLGFVFLGRFLQGRWRTMRVIEHPHETEELPAPPLVVEAPTVMEVETL